MDDVGVCMDTVDLTPCIALRSSNDEVQSVLLAPPARHAQRNSSKSIHGKVSGALTTPWLCSISYYFANHTSRAAYRRAQTLKA